MSDAGKKGDDRELLAYRAAVAAFMTTFGEVIGDADMNELYSSQHVHHSLLGDIDGQAACVVHIEISFSRKLHKHEIEELAKGHMWQRPRA